MLDVTIVSVAIGIYLIINVLIGWWSKEKAKTVEGWMLGRRMFGPVVVAFAYFATRLSASAYIGEPAWCYSYGWPYHWIGVFNAAFWTAAVLLMTGRLRDYSFGLRTLTVPEFLGERYQSATLRVYTSALLVLFYLLMIYAQLKGVVSLLNVTIGTAPMWAIIIFAIIVMIYVILGGYVSVIYTDVIQGILMVIFAVVIFGVSFAAVGFSYANVETQLNMINPALNSFSQGWAGISATPLFSDLGVICLPFYLFISLVTNPYCAVRFMSLKDSRGSTIFKFTATLITTGLVTFLLYNAGLFARILYPNLPNADYAIPTLVANLVPGAVGAVLVTALFAAMMSTVSGLLMVCNTSVAKDIYHRTINPNAPEFKVNLIGKVTAAVVTLIAVILSFIALPEFLSYILFIAAGGSGILTLAPLIFGLYWDRSTKYGAISSSVIGVGIFAYLRLIYPINLWVSGVLAGSISVIVMIIVSILTKPVDKSILEAMRKPIEAA